MKLVRATILTFLSIISLSDALTITCTYKQNSTYFSTYSNAHSYYYICFDSTISITNKSDDRTVSGVTGTHTTYSSNGYVEGYVVKDQPLHYLHKNLQSYYSALRVLWIENCGLKELEKESFKYTSLNYLNLQNNDIEIIDKEVFDYFTSLYTVNLKNNKIKVVYSGVFTRHASMVYLYMEGNKCITNETSTGSTTNVKTYSSKIYEECDPIKWALDRCHEHFTPLSSLYVKEFAARRTCERVVKNSQCLISNYQYSIQREELSELRNFRRKMLSFDLECKVRGEKNETCEVQRLKSIDKESEIERVKYNDCDSIETTSPITIVRMVDQHCAYIPHNFNKKFSQITDLSIINSGLLDLRVEDFRTFFKLNNLDLSKNKIAVIQGDVFESNMKTLEYLDLSFNNIGIIEENIFKELENLKEIRLNGNKIESIKGNIFAKNLKLKTAHLQDNLLTEVSASLLNQLKTSTLANFTNNACLNITLPGDEVTTEIIVKCSAPIDVSCEYEFDKNNVYTCKATLEPITDDNVNTINFSGDHKEGYGDDDVKQLLIESQTVRYFPPKVLVKYLPKINIIKIKNSGLAKIRKNDFVEFPQLDTLIINHNALEEIEADAFENMHSKLKELDLSYSNLTILPRALFQKLVKLEVLRLDNNEITIMEGDFLPCSKKIKDFSMRNNLLSSVSNDALKCLTKAEVDLRGNTCTNVFVKKITDVIMEIMEDC